MPDRPAFLLVQPQKGPMHHAARLPAVMIKQPTPETCTLARPAAFPDNPAIESEAFDEKCIVSKGCPSGCSVGCAARCSPDLRRLFRHRRQFPMGRRIDG